MHNRIVILYVCNSLCILPGLCALFLAKTIIACISLKNLIFKSCLHRVYGSCHALMAGRNFRCFDCWLQNLLVAKSLVCEDTDTELFLGNNLLEGNFLESSACQNQVLAESYQGSALNSANTEV